MSLKSFHIVFIGLSALLAFWLGIWSFRSYAEEPRGLLLAAGLVASLVGTGLIFYGIRFLRKLKHVSFL